MPCWMKLKQTHACLTRGGGDVGGAAVKVQTSSALNCTYMRAQSCLVIYVCTSTLKKCCSVMRLGCNNSPEMSSCSHNILRLFAFLVSYD